MVIIIFTLDIHRRRDCSLHRSQLVHSDVSWTTYVEVDTFLMTSRPTRHAAKFPTGPTLHLTRYTKNAVIISLEVFPHQAWSAPHRSLSSTQNFKEDMQKNAGK